MSSPSVSYAESVLSHLEKVQQLPVEVQIGIARRVESCIKIARAAKNEAIVANIASSYGRAGQGHRAWDNGPAMGRTSDCRGMVLCHDEPHQGLPRSIARASHHRSN